MMPNSPTGNSSLTPQEIFTLRNPQIHKFTLDKLHVIREFITILPGVIRQKFVNSSRLPSVCRQKFMNSRLAGTNPGILPIDFPCKNFRQKKPRKSEFPGF